MRTFEMNNLRPSYWSNKAIGDLSKAAASCQRSSPGYSKACVSAIKRIERAEHIFIPYAPLLDSRMDYSEMRDVCRLPYENICIEAFFSNEKTFEEILPGQIQCERQIILAEQRGDDIFVSGFAHHGGRWLMEIASLLVSPRSMQWDPGINRTVFASRIYFPSGCTPPTDEMYSAAQQDAAGAAWTVLSLCIVLATSNLDSVFDSESPPAALNKARKKRGKRPLPPYRCLRIDFHAPSKAAMVESGDRTKPRTHLRRGHIRRLPTGRMTWVRPCLVAVENKGVIEKDYALGRRLAGQARLMANNRRLRQ